MTVTLLIIERVICMQTNTALMTKNGIFIFTMNGCTTKEAVVIISCQYNANNRYDEIESGHESSLSAVKVCSVYMPQAPIPSTTATNRTAKSYIIIFGGS